MSASRTQGTLGALCLSAGSPSCRVVWGRRVPAGWGGGGKGASRLLGAVGCGEGQRGPWPQSCVGPVPSAMVLGKQDFHLRNMLESQPCFLTTQIFKRW